MNMTDILNALRGYKTLIVSGILIVAGLWKAFRPQATVPDETMVSQFVDWLLNSSGGIMLLMRYFTTTPVGGTPAA